MADPKEMRVVRVLPDGEIFEDRVANLVGYEVTNSGCLIVEAGEEVLGYSNGEWVMFVIQRC